MESATMDAPAMRPMPGDPAGGMDMPAFTGGTSTPQSATMRPDVQEALQTATKQLREMNVKLDGVLDGVKGIATTFPGQQDGPKQIADLVMQLKKALTSYVLDVVKQAPKPPQTEGAPGMR